MERDKRGRKEGSCKDRELARGRERDGERQRNLNENRLKGADR